MKRGVIFNTFFALLTGLASLVSAEVPSLNEDSLNELVKTEPLVMVKFFAPWCGHCKNLAPEYEAAAEQLKEEDIELVEVDCTQEAEFCQKSGVRGYPTLQVYHNGENVGTYSGARKQDAIVKYMQKLLLPAVTPVTNENVKDFISQDQFTVVGLFDDDKKNETFTNLAEKLRDDYAFGASSDAKVAKALNVTIPAIVAFNNLEDGEAFVYSAKEWNDDDIVKHLVSSRILLIDELQQSNYATYMQDGKPMGIVFYESPESREELVALFKPLAKTYKENTNIVFLDANRYGGFAEKLNLEQKWPAFAIHDVQQQQKYPFESTDLTNESVGEFLEKFAKGELTPSIKSEPIPEEQDNLYVVVANSFNDVVLDTTKDVLIEFYAPWCGYCKKLAPTYEELADQYAGEDRVVIAKIDATANDVPVQISGFPTIMLFKADDKENPVRYEGSRTLEDLVEFVKTNGAFEAAPVPIEKEEEAAESAETAETAETAAKVEEEVKEQKGEEDVEDEL
ncbi:protein disulfide isomerase [Schizosaccharomyces japonicus yFS275]|uniref:Protein disulfide-isomerase n=1 Tax=Schizosaccharomyces japonicus (strain yFS275 / FY16936) TaxID=402676 RepID=B6JV82_SCHJY|nr:protein disulfide isomerase [Schizosaccharomyces japonicus yFS275]EEB05283.1 protein disulfide isomerase [Schizosaccharomyces japonicus yFS275]